jgi:broad-specificity NMP kinase
VAGTPILIVVGGLPATGKSTVASTLVGQTVAAIVGATEIAGRPCCVHDEPDLREPKTHR